MTQFRYLVPLHQAQDWIRDGDLLLFRRRGLIAAAGRGEHSHAALAGWWGETLCCLEVRGRSGGRVVTLASQVEQFPGQIDVFLADPDNRWPEFDRRQTVQAMLQFAGTRYGYRNFLRVALRHIPGIRLIMSPKTDDSAMDTLGPICSQACVMATRLGGGVDPVPQLADELTEPADLARSPFYRYRLTLIPDDVTQPTPEPQPSSAEPPRWLRLLTLVGVFLLIFVLTGRATQGQSSCPGGYCYGPGAAGKASDTTPPAGGLSVSQPIPEPLSRATARLENHLPGGAIVYGSGVLIARDDRWGWVLTCDHLFREGAGQVRVVLPSSSGQVFEGRVFARDSLADLALVGIAAPQTQPIALADTHPSPGQTVAWAGYGRTGRLHAAMGQVLGYVSTNVSGNRETLQITGAAQDGDSGGPIVDAQGRLVAIVWGTDGYRTVGTYCGRIRAFLRNFFAPREEQVPVLGPAVPPVPSNPPQDPPGNPHDPLPPGSSSGDSLLSRLRDRLEGLQGKVEAAESGQRSLSERLRHLETTLGVVSDLRQRVEKAEEVVGRENIRAVIRETAADLLRDRGPSWASALLSAVLTALGWTGPPSLALAFAARLAVRLLERRLRTSHRAEENVPSNPNIVTQ